MRYCLDPAERCRNPPAVFGFCRVHWTALDEHGRAFYQRRYARLYAKLKQRRVSLRTYHSQALGDQACRLEQRKWPLKRAAQKY